MGDILRAAMYGSISARYAFGRIGVQWHITVECDQSCKHCYMFGSDTYPSEKAHPLTFEQCCRFVDQYDQICERTGVQGEFHITGGDPILRPDFWDILEYIRQKPRLHVSLMGNPYHITDEVAKRMRTVGVQGYQISLDGLEETHDYFRKKGSFKDSLRALEVLNRNGISTNVMFTLSKQNAPELIQLYLFLNSLSYINGFSFDRIVPVGAGNKLAEEGSLTAEEHRNLLYQMFITEIDNPGYAFQSRKDELWRVLLYELGLVRPLPEEPLPFCQGCGIPFGTMTVLADGTIYSCRRLPLKIGKIPEDNLWDVFVNSPLLNKLRDLDNYEKCRDCELGYYCRGCPAVKYGYTGDPFKADPHCWKEVQAREQKGGQLCDL